MAQSSTKHSSQTLGKRKIPAYICIHFVKAEFAQVHQWEQTHGERRGCGKGKYRNTNFKVNMFVCTFAWKCFRFQTSWNQIHLVLGPPTWQEAIFNVWQCHSRAVGGRSEKYNYIKPHTYKYILFGVSVLYMKYFVIVYVYINIYIYIASVYYSSDPKTLVSHISLLNWKQSNENPLWFQAPTRHHQYSFQAIPPRAPQGYKSIWTYLFCLHLKFEVAKFWHQTFAICYFYQTLMFDGGAKMC